jgi:hypothetical protein
MLFDESMTSPAGSGPQTELVADEHSSTANGAAIAYGGVSPDAVMEELWSIDEQISAIQRLQRDDAISADELLTHCMTAWSRIKGLRQRLGIPCR